MRTDHLNFNPRTIRDRMELEKVINILDDYSKEKVCESVICVIQRRMLILGASYPIMSLEKAEEDIQHPRNPREFIVAIYPRSYFEKIKAGLESVTEIDRRLLELRGLNGAVIIDDSYNANPASVRAAIDILSSRGGESILVLGDMLELGEQKNFYHQQIGQLAQQSGIAHLFCYGDLSRFAAESFGTNAYHFSEQSDLLAALKPLLKAQSTVLVKGSNGMKMNNIVKALVE